MSAAVAAAAAAAALAAVNQRRHNPTSSPRNAETRAENVYSIIGSPMALQVPIQQPLGLSRYESQKRRDWIAFCQYLRNHRPPLALQRCSGAHVLEFLKYLDQFGKTKVHSEGCPFFGQPNPPAACQCPLRQAWGSLDALVGRLRAAFEENGGSPDTNPFGSRAVNLYLREVRDAQAKARGIAHERKKRRKPPSKQHAKDHDDPDQNMRPTDSSSSSSSSQDLINSDGRWTYPAVEFH